jgi:hypothetical protein
MSRSKKQLTEEPERNEVEHQEDHESMQENDPLESADTQGVTMI